LALAVWLASCSGGGPAAEAASESASSEVLAVVDGVEIRDADLTAATELRQLERQLYEARADALEQEIARRLIAKAAEERGMTVEEFEEQEIASKVEAPTDVEVEGFYEQQKARIRRPLEEVRPQIAELLVSMREREVRGALAEELRAEAEVRTFLSPPRFEVDLSEAPMRGPDDAPVRIVEFSDFQCPFCRRVQPTLARVQDEYGDRIQWSFKDLPLISVHPDAHKAAQAARCAGDQGKFWEYRTAMFDADQVSDELHEQTAAALELDADQFAECLESEKHAEAVDEDLAEAQSLGLTGTPAFLINGVVLSGAQPVEAFLEVIEAELARDAE